MDKISHKGRADKDREVYWRGAAQAIAMRAEVTVLLGKTGVQTLKLSPQPHSPLALGF
jgi:hypothetical protein